MRRNKKLAQEYLRQQREVQTIKVNTIPTKAKIDINGREKWVPVKPPKYVAIEDLPKDSMHPFVEICSNETAIWLQKYSESIMYSDTDERHPLTNPKLDFTNPEISGYRIYLKGIGCVHIQISRISNSLFQLDYYEIAKKHYSKVSKKYVSKKLKVVKRWSVKKAPMIPKVLMVAIVNITEIGFNCVRLVYASSDLELMDKNMSRKESDLEYATRAALFFRCIQVYMRNYDFEASNTNRLEISPLKIFGKEIEFKSNNS